MAGPSRRVTRRCSDGVPSQKDSQPIVVLDLDLNSTPSESSELEESSSTSCRRITPTGNLLDSAPPPHASVIDVDQIEDVSDEGGRSRQAKIIDCESYPDSEEVQNFSKGKKVTRVPPIQKEPSLTCSMCMDPLGEAATTDCGHIYCYSCLREFIQTHKECPTCGRKLAISNFHRLYFPAME
ncbi:E3 ubiquitin-protein ligase RNF4-like [Zingiber officinale]|uniref:E3 ubiquitin-protein ligase RNF4-like n=1 Tax=Zingiber officinale TaxID=94328 RepID=UPI001C4DA9A7|nr:E3 ubiquitin-protein ligase RNF4-like [Zingiber officinale]